jgi:hypothetical protein
MPQVAIGLLLGRIDILRGLVAAHPAGGGRSAVGGRNSQKEGP